MHKQKFHSKWIKYALLASLLIIILSLVRIYVHGVDRIGFKIINLSFKIPEGYRAEYKAKTRDEHEMININYGSSGNPEWMSIQIARVNRCEGSTSVGTGNEVLVAEKWPLDFSKSHGRYGSRDQNGDTCLDNNIRLIIYRYVRDNEGAVEKQFNEILESATYFPKLI